MTFMLIQCLLLKIIPLYLLVMIVDCHTKVLCFRTEICVHGIMIDGEKKQNWSFT